MGRGTGFWICEFNFIWFKVNSGGVKEFASNYLANIYYLWTETKLDI